MKASSKPAKKSAKPARKAAAAKPASKAAKAPAKGAKSSKPAKVAATKPIKPSKSAKPAATTPAAAAEAPKIAPKTIDQKSPKKGKAPSPQVPRFGEPLFRPGAPAPKPLIASGPKAAPASAPLAAVDGQPIKSPLDKKQIEHFREILLQKRAELVGDVATMETEALKSQSGSLSHLPQHMAEQGSDVYGQSLSLDLAAADRRLIKEIDDALLRIQRGVYGVCERTGKPIKLERLNELPWARYSIEAARELERRGMSQ